MTGLDRAFKHTMPAYSIQVLEIVAKQTDRNRPRASAQRFPIAQVDYSCPLLD